MYWKFTSGFPSVSPPSPSPSSPSPFAPNVFKLLGIFLPLALISAMSLWIWSRLMSFLTATRKSRIFVAAANLSREEASSSLRIFTKCVRADFDSVSNFFRKPAMSCLALRKLNSATCSSALDGTGFLSSMCPSFNSVTQYDSCRQSRVYAHRLRCLVGLSPCFSAGRFVLLPLQIQQQRQQRLRVADETET